LYNAAMAVQGDGSMSPVWTAKTFLVPFTEQTPFRSLFGRFVEGRSGEWRWLWQGDRSPWFPEFLIYRETIEHGWDAAMKQLQMHFCR
jgi:hypothetical protein